MLGLLRQHFTVCGDCRFEIPLTCQRIAQVVDAGYGLLGGERFCGSRIVPGAVTGGCAPAGVFEKVRSTLGVTTLKQLDRLLVSTLPQVVPDVRLRGQRQ